MGVSKNRGKTPKMDGENNGKPYEQMDDLGVPLFLETPICFNEFPYWNLEEIPYFEAILGGLPLILNHQIVILNSHVFLETPMYCMENFLVLESRSV